MTSDGQRADIRLTVTGVSRDLMVVEVVMVVACRGLKAIKAE